MIVGGTERGMLDVAEELLHILNFTLSESDAQGRADLILCSQVRDTARMLWRS